MATLKKLYYEFENMIDECISHIGLSGKVYKADIYHLDKTRLSFFFTEKYLKIHDHVDYDRHNFRDIELKSVFDDTVLHLIAIKKQFNYYFNAIWC